MNSLYGQILKLNISGQSHGPYIGMSLDGIPAGLPVDIEKLQHFLDRRAPGRSEYSTTRKEPDIPEFQSGIENGITTGTTIRAIIQNTNTKSADYEQIRDIPRPGHADYTAWIKYGDNHDIAGGGHLSGRLTAPLCIAGGLCMQWLEQQGIRIGAHIVSIGGIADEPVYLDWVDPDLDAINKDFPVLNPEAGNKMKEAIAAAKSDGDSVGGLIECIVTGIPAGLGDPMFNGMENRISQIIFGIPAIKGISFGSGFSGSYLRGSQNNDPFVIRDGKIQTEQNYAGGILGGITNGMPLVFEVAVKPTPSISKPQKSISLSRMEETQLVINGRHDPCIVPRAVPVVEAAAAIAIMDALLSAKYEERNDIQSLRQQINNVDHNLVQLFSKRMDIAHKIADYKKQNGLPVYDQRREQEILDTVAQKAGSEMSDYLKHLYTLLFELSRDYQTKLLDNEPNTPANSTEVI